MNTKKTLLLIFMSFFLFGMIASTASAATIQALKIQGNIPTDPTDPFWSQYGPTKGKHVVIDLDPQMITNPIKYLRYNF